MAKSRAPVGVRTRMDSTLAVERAVNELKPLDQVRTIESGFVTIENERRDEVVDREQVLRPVWCSTN